jgi:hypothetical protein
MATQRAKWVPDTESDYELLKGMQVISRDGEKLGKITQIVHPDHADVTGTGGHFFLFEPGLLKSWFGGLDEAYLPEAAIMAVTDEGVVIELTEAEIKQRLWDMPTDSGYIRS